jgi:glutamyl-tRNA reductase
MHRIGTVGISWRHGTAEAIAAFTIARDARTERVPRLAAAIQVPELVYLATCNRVEVAFASDGRTPLSVLRRRVFAALMDREPRVGEAEQTLRAWQGEGAAEHLFLVAAGLESARVGEQEIVLQVRQAMDESRRLELLGPHLEPLFTEALKVAKRVRPLTEGRVGRVSLAEIAARFARDRIRRTPGRVALVGVSPMTEQCARELSAQGIGLVIVNRTIERAATLAQEVGAEARSLADFRESPEGVEALIVATGSTTPIFGRADLERIAARTPSAESPLIIDLAVPPDVSPEDALAADVPRIGMDEIALAAAEDRDALVAEFADARALVDASLTDLRRQMAERLIGPMIADLHRRFRHTAIDGVERLFKRDLAGLGEPERDAVRRWAETLARRFAHVPSVGLRDLVFQAGPSAVEAFFSHTDPELAKQLHVAAGQSGAAMLIEQELEEP